MMRHEMDANKSGHADLVRASGMLRFCKILSSHSVVASKTYNWLTGGHTRPQQEAFEMPAMGNRISMLKLTTLSYH